jgi:hypothetical protein
LARNRRVDLHTALELLADGFPAGLAVRMALTPERERHAA